MRLGGAYSIMSQGVSSLQCSRTTGRRRVTCTPNTWSTLKPVQHIESVCSWPPTELERPSRGPMRSPCTLPGSTLTGGRVGDGIGRHRSGRLATQARRSGILFSLSFSGLQRKSGQACSPGIVSSTTPGETGSLTQSRVRRSNTFPAGCLGSGSNRMTKNARVFKALQRTLSGSMRSPTLQYGASV